MIETPGTPAIAETPVEEKPFAPFMTAEKVVIEITGASKNLYRSAEEWWRAVPPERKRIFGIVSLSVGVSLAMSLTASIIARLFVKREPVEKPVVEKK